MAPKRVMPAPLMRCKAPIQSSIVGIHRIFDQNRDVHTFEGIGQFLHGERISRSTCSDPKVSPLRL